MYTDDSPSAGFLQRGTWAGWREDPTTIPDLPRFRAQKPSPWPASLDEDTDIHSSVSPQPLSGYGSRNRSVCPSNTFFIPTSHTPTQWSWYPALTAELFQNIPHGNKITSLLRLLPERPVLNTVKNSSQTCSIDLSRRLKYPGANCPTIGLISLSKFEVVC